VGTANKNDGENSAVVILHYVTRITKCANAFLKEIGDNQTSLVYHKPCRKKIKKIGYDLLFEYGKQTFLRTQIRLL